MNTFRDGKLRYMLVTGVKLSWVFTEVGILIRRDLLDFSNGNAQLARDKLIDTSAWIAGIQVTIKRLKFEWRVNVSDWLQDRR